MILASKLSNVDITFIVSFKVQIKMIMGSYSPEQKYTLGEANLFYCPTTLLPEREK